MCDFCKFSYGTADTVFKAQDHHSLKGYATHEIRPLVNGKYAYFVRAFNENDELIHKSSLFIEYCPMCGDALKGGEF